MILKIKIVSYIFIFFVSDKNFGAHQLSYILKSVPGLSQTILNCPETVTFS